MLIWGTKFFGHVDSINDRIYVATRFHHCCLIPLVYQGSYIVIDDTHALPTSINFKSILFAYLRLALGISIIGAILPLILIVSDWSWDTEHVQIASIALAVIVLSSIVSVHSFKWTKANEETKTKIFNRIKTDQNKLVTIGPIRIDIA